MQKVGCRVKLQPRKPRDCNRSNQLVNQPCKPAKATALPSPNKRVPCIPAAPTLHVILLLLLARLLRLVIHQRARPRLDRLGGGALERHRIGRLLILAALLLGLAILLRLIRACGGGVSRVGASSAVQAGR